MKFEKWKIFLNFAVCILQFAIFISPSPAGMAVQTCFSPYGKCASHILREIGRAEKELLVAVYAFTSDELAWSLVKAAERGVKVQVIVDREFDAKRIQTVRGAGYVLKVD